MSIENGGFGELARVLQNRMAVLDSRPPMLDFGEIQKDMSLVTNTFPHSIPATDYTICRSVCYDPAVSLTETEFDGTHPHGPGGGHSQYTGSGIHSHPDSEGAHVHQVKLPKKMWRIQPGDRVLVAWVGDDPVVVDVIMNATETLRS
jgi:hypothetical protein